MDTRVAIELSTFVQHQGCLMFIVVEGTFDDLVFQCGSVVGHLQVQRIVVIEQTVGHNFLLNLLHHRRKPTKSFDETAITVDFDVQFVYDVVVWAPILAEVLVFRRNLFQCVGQIESHVLLLGIKQDGEVVGLVDDIEHLLMLAFVILVKPLLCF